MPAPKGHKPYPNKDGLFLGGVNKKYTKKELDKLADELFEWLQDSIEGNNENFWWKNWCFKKGFSPSRIAEWARENERFSVAYDLINQWQESVVSEGALTRRFDSSFSKFYLAAKHGWREKDDENTISEKVSQQYDDLMKQIESLQSGASSLKMAESNKRAEEKS